MVVNDEVERGGESGREKKRDREIRKVSESKSEKQW